MSRALLELDSRMTSLEDEQVLLMQNLKDYEKNKREKGTAYQEETEKPGKALRNTRAKMEKSDLTAGAPGKEKDIDNWTIVGFSGRCVVIRDRQGSHFLHVGAPLDNVRITCIDVSTGSIWANEGTVRYR